MCWYVKCRVNKADLDSPDVPSICNSDTRLTRSKVSGGSAASRTHSQLDSSVTQVMHISLPRNSKSKLAASDLDQLCHISLTSLLGLWLASTLPQPNQVWHVEHPSRCGGPSYEKHCGTNPPTLVSHTNTWSFFHFIRCEMFRYNKAVSRQRFQHSYR